jgi:DNA mismatch repair ATPase MutS
MLLKAESDGLMHIRIGRGTTLNSGIAIAYAALDYILRHNKSKTLFATHYHELHDMLTTIDEEGHRTTRPGVEFWCTDVDEVVRAQEKGGLWHTIR